VHTSQDTKQPLAMVTLHEAHLCHVLQDSGSENKSVDANGSLADLCHNQEIEDLIVKKCNTLGKKNGFKPMEVLRVVTLTSDEWTPESGLVTAAQKTQRAKIANTFENGVETSD
jgi:long-chain acyl-CoA synthetase